MNSNILILNKLISKFILDRSKKFDVEHFANFYKFPKKRSVVTLRSHFRFRFIFIDDFVTFWHIVWSVLDHFGPFYTMILSHFRGVFNSKSPSIGSWPSLKMIFAPGNRPIRCVICNINICQNRTCQISYLIGSRWRAETNWVLIRWIGQLP